MVSLWHRSALEHVHIVFDEIVAGGIHGSIWLMIVVTDWRTVELEGHVRHGDLDSVCLRDDAINTDGVPFKFDPRGLAHDLPQLRL